MSCMIALPNNHSISTKPLQLTLKQEAHFNYTTGLVLVHARRAEDVTRRVAGRPNKGKVPASEEALVLKSGCQRDRPARAARTVHQLTEFAAALPVLAMYSPRPESENPCLKVRFTNTAPPWVDAPCTTPIFRLVGTLPN